MENTELTIEQISANRFNLQQEYNAIKSHLLLKIKRMEEIEQEVEIIDREIKSRNTKK